MEIEELQQKFEKAKNCLRVLYYDHTYGSRAPWVNEILDDPEVQGWIVEEDKVWEEMWTEMK